ncbi:MAG TPA: hypothetical protein VGK05_03835 [Acidimicrobiia bacterium]
MPTPDNRPHDVDDTPFDEDARSRQEFEDSGDILFGDEDPRDVAAGRVVPGDLGGPPGTASRRFESIDDVDAALFGHAPSRAPAAAATEEAFLAQTHPTAPATMPPLLEDEERAWIDEDEPAWLEEEENEAGFVTDDRSSERDLSPSSDDKRGRRRALVAAGFITVAVIVGAAIGAMALNRSDDPGRSVNTGSESTTTTASTTTTVVTTPAAPETSAPPTTSARPAPTTAARSIRPPASAPADPPPSDPPPPPPPPAPPPPPPSTSPPTSPPTSTVPLPPPT